MASNKKQIILTCNAQAVKDVFEYLNEQLAKIKLRRDSLLKQYEGRMWTEDAKREFKRLGDDIAAITSMQQKNEQTMRKYGEVIKDLAGSRLKDLRKALREGKLALENMSSNDPKRAKLVADLKLIKKQIDANTGAINKQGGALANTAKNLATYMIGFAGFNKVKTLIEGVFQSNTKLSDSLANIRKVSGLSSEAINTLYKNISKIDSRNTIEMLNSLAYTGAKLGIGQNYGVEGLTGFVKAAEQVQMALGEDLGEKALPALAKMTEVMGLIPKYGVEQSMQKAASAIFQLGATSTATGENIVEFSKRLYGLANVSRVSTEDLLALGSASDAMGLMPEVSATAFNKLLTSLQQNHNMIEKTLELQPGLIKSYYDQGKTMDAIVAIFDKMNEKGNLNLLGSVFKDLGSDGARLVNVMATMSDRVDILKKHLETSRNAFKEGEAVIGEYMIQNQTAAALIERASNLWAKAFTNPEGVDMVKQLAQAWYDLSKKMTESESSMWILRSSLESIALAIKSIIALSPFLIRFGIVATSAFGFVGAYRGVGKLRLALVGMISELKAATTAGAAFNTIMKSNAIIGLISAVATVATLLWDFSKAAEEASKREAERQAKLKAAFRGSKEAVDNVVKSLKIYKKVLDQANLSEEQRLQMLNDFRNEYQDYLDYLGIEIKTVDDLRDAYGRVIEVMKIKKAYEERENFRTQKNEENKMERIGAQSRVEGAARAFGLDDVDKEFLEKNQGKGSMELYAELIKRRYGGNITVSARGQAYRVSEDRKQVYTGTDLGSKELLDAINDYIKAYRAEVSINREIDQMFDSEFTWTDENGKQRKLSEFDIDDYDLRVQKARWKRKGSLENKKDDDDAKRKAREAQRKAKEEMRKEMEDAEKNITGVITKIEEWYRLQEAAINEARADGELTESQAADMVRQLNILKNETLSTARRAVTSGDDKLWNETKENMQNYMADTSEVSQGLLKEIVDADIKSLHDSLSKFNGSKDVFGLSTGAFFDQMNNKAAGNVRASARLKAQLYGQMEQMVKQYRLVEQAQDKMQKDLEQLGFVTETYEQLAARLQAGITKKPDTVIKPGKERIEGVTASFASMEREPYAGDAQGMGQWLSDFSEGGTAEWASGLPQIGEWIKDAQKYKQEIAEFYQTLTDYETAYLEQNEAATQQAEERLTEILSRRFSDRDAFSMMSMKFMGQGPISYRVNIENQEEAEKWLLQFASKSEDELEDWAQAFPELTAWIELIKQKHDAIASGHPLGEGIKDELERAMPGIQALFYQLDGFVSKIPETIKQQVDQMTQRQPVGIDEMRQQYEQRRSLTEQLYDTKISEANAMGGPRDENGDNEAAIELRRQRNQALIDLDYNWEKQVYELQERMGVTWQQEYENEVASYKNMLDKKLISEKQFQQKKSQLQMQLGLKYGQQFNGLMSGMVDAMQDYEVAAVNAKYDVLISAAKANGEDTTALEEEKEAEILEIQKKYADAQMAIKISEIIANTAVAIMNAWATLPPPAAAVATALIAATGALQVATAVAERQKIKGMSSGSGKKASSSSNSNSNTKLVHGMLTYDEGTDIPTSSIRGGSGLYAGTDGNVYRANATPSLPEGVSLVRQPIATTVNGHRALVAEKGPEIVIGRLATRHIQMNEPGLLRHLAAVNGQYRTHDSGTGFGGRGGDMSAYGEGSGSNADSRVAAALEQNTAVMIAMQQTIADLQRNGIAAYIDKYGKGGLIEEVRSGLKFVNKYHQ